MVSLLILRVTIMSEDFGRIASALERIADALEKKWHIDIDHGHIERIDNILGELDTRQFKPEFYSNNVSLQDNKDETQ